MTEYINKLGNLSLEQEREAVILAEDIIHYPLERAPFDVKVACTEFFTSVLLLMCEAFVPGSCPCASAPEVSATTYLPNIFNIRGFFDMVRNRELDDYVSNSVAYAESKGAKKEDLAFYRHYGRFKMFEYTPTINNALAATICYLEDDLPKHGVNVPAL